MFGYLRPDQNELKVKEYRLYKSAYCGLCRFLGKEYGLLARMTLSYDCTVLAMLSAALKKEQLSVKPGHCTFSPFKKCLFCECEGDSFRFAGAVSVIMTYYKLKDTIRDSGPIISLIAMIGGLLLRLNHKRAAMAFPEIEDAVHDMMVSQELAESEKSSTDAAADPTAKLISFLCMNLGEEKDRVVLKEFGYHTGRWIYLMDAADDFEKDVRKHNFNPFESLLDSGIENAMLRCNESLNLTAAKLTEAYDLLPVEGEFKAILDNIIYRGLSLRQKTCLFDKYTKKRCKGRVNRKNTKSA